MSSDEGTNNPIPPGFTLRCTLSGHKKWINWITWSPDGRMLASSANDYTVIWDIETGGLYQKLRETNTYRVAWSPDGQSLASGGIFSLGLWNVETGKRYKRLIPSVPVPIYSVAWSPDGRMLASGSESKSDNLQLWDVKTGQLLQKLKGHSDNVRSIMWSPDGQLLASGSDDHTVQVWDVKSGQSLQKFRGHSSYILNVAWSLDGSMLASASGDRTIRIWDPGTGRQISSLEGHTEAVTCISFSYDGRLLASKSRDGTILFWRSDTWERIVIMNEPSAKVSYNSSLAFFPKSPILATLGEKDKIIRIWDLDIDVILGNATTHSVHYANAKVILVGDSSVGKSGLGLVLTDQLFVPTESTHGRRIWIFDNQEVEIDGRSKETRETLLWDLAGQPGYRLIHQLHLTEVAVALVVFDSHSETDPFAGVSHWVRALRMAQRVQGDSALLMKKFLVAARIDRGTKRVSRERIAALVEKSGFDGYFETSAKEGLNIAILAEAIKNAIDWRMLPKVTSTDLFQLIKVFLVTEKEAGRLLSTCDDLYRAFLKSERNLSEIKDLHKQFETCIGLVESKGLIRRISFGNLVLLQPELLDAYSSALVNAVRDEPDGLGSILEEKVRTGNFLISKNERIAYKEQEKLLLIAMVEDLLRYEIALREQGEDGPYLVFPSQSTRENPDLPGPEGKAVIFGFEGPVQNIYATLAVRLSHSGLFTKKELWKNAVTYTAKMGGTYGIFLHDIEEGRAELTLFFDKKASEETRFHFEEYIRTHLDRQALQETIQRRRIFICPECGTPLDDLSVIRRQERRFNWMTCGVCDTKVSIIDREERLVATPASFVLEMDRVADMQREHSAGASKLQGKIATGDFDVFLCHNGKNKPRVKEIGEKLKEQGILPWLDEWELRPGLSWQRLLEKQIRHIKTVAVFVGKDGIGPWQQKEIEAFLIKFANRNCPVIPVLLSDAPRKPRLPIFLESMTWVDFRSQDPDPMERLIWGITGVRERF